MKKYLFLICFSFLILAQNACKSTQKTQNSNTQNVPYIPPIINTDVPNPEANKPEPKAIDETSPSTPPPIHETDISNKTEPTPEPTLPAELPNTMGGYSKDKIRFRIQIGAFKTALSENDPFFKNVAGEEVRVERSPDNYYRYSLGWFDNFQQAENFKNELKGKGFANAFLVAFGDDDKRVNVAIDKLLEWYLK